MAALTPVGDLGLGSNLANQVADETEEEKRRRKLGLAPDQVQNLYGYGQTGIAPLNLGLKGAARY